VSKVVAEIVGIDKILGSAFETVTNKEPFVLLSEVEIVDIGSGSVEVGRANTGSTPLGRVEEEFSSVFEGEGSGSVLQVMNVSGSKRTLENGDNKAVVDVVSDICDDIVDMKEGIVDDPTSSANVPDVAIGVEYSAAVSPEGTIKAEGWSVSRSK
jgi:hypothetical protein